MDGTPSSSAAGGVAPTAERHETIIIGGGQSGLSVGYHLARRGRSFVILDAHDRVGDQWRERWDSLRLFTPARFSGLDGMPFPAGQHDFVTKDTMGDYLEAYAQRFDLPVRNGVYVDSLTREGDHFVVTAGERRWESDNVVVAMSNFQKPRVPAFAEMLDPRITQLHSIEYRRPSQLQDGPVLLVGAGNSGAEIALDVADTHRTYMAGRNVGHVPFDIDGVAARHGLIRLVLRGLFHRVLTVKTPMGRKARPTMITKGGPWVRVKPKTIAGAGIDRVPRVRGVENGMPVLDDGRVLDVTNVVWCTGFEPGFSWIKLPVLGELEPQHESGIVPGQPGLYFVGLEFLHSVSSTMIHGVGRDADRVAAHVAARAAAAPSAEPLAGATLAPAP